MTASVKRFIPAALVAAALLVPQHHAQAFWSTTTCGGGSLESCVDFRLSSNGTYYYFTVEYLSSSWSDTGVITAIGLYDLGNDPAYSFTDIQFVEASDGLTWTAPSNCQVTGDGVGKSLFRACSSSNQGVNNGLAVGQFVTFKFKSNVPISEDDFFASGFLGARAHIQSIEIEDCSVKVDHRTGFFSGENGDGTVDGCGGGTSVPEPGTMLLLGTGLAAVLGMGAVRRRREDEEVA